MALAWCFQDQRSPLLKRVLDRIASSGAVAPQIWPLEILNGLLLAQRQQRIDGTQRQTLVTFLEGLPVSLDEETARRAWGSIYQIADLHGLTIYDASYLELALRSGLPLATLDRRLAQAASKAGLDVLPEA